MQGTCPSTWGFHFRIPCRTILSLSSLSPYPRFFGMHPVQFYYENARDTSHFRGIPSILPLFLLLMRRLNYSATTAESTVAVLSHLHGQSAHFVVSPQHSFCSASQHSAFFELLLQEHAAAADIAATTANVINTFFIVTNN